MSMERTSPTVRATSTLPALAQSYLAAIVESSDDAIIAKNLDGIIQSCNAAAERLFGYAPSELIGQSVRILIPPDRQTEEDEILARIRRGERVDHFETVRLAKDGRPIDISLTVSPVRDASGAIVGVSKIARDITERKRAAAALAAQQEWFRVTLGSIGDGIIASDPEGRVTYMNGVAETLTGWTNESAQGTAAGRCLPDRERDDATAGRQPGGARHSIGTHPGPGEPHGADQPRRHRTSHRGQRRAHPRRCRTHSGGRARVPRLHRTAPRRRGDRGAAGMVRDDARKHRRCRHRDRRARTNRVHEPGRRTPDRLADGHSTRSRVHRRLQHRQRTDAAGRSRILSRASCRKAWSSASRTTRC